MKTPPRPEGQDSVSPAGTSLAQTGSCVNFYQSRFYNFSHYWLYRLACEYSIAEMRQGLRFAERELSVCEVAGDTVGAAWWHWCIEAWKSAIPYREFADSVEVEVKQKKRKTRTKRPDYEQIKRDHDIVDFVARHTALRKSGNRYVGLCPLHPDRHPSLVIYPDQGKFHCFGCRAHGDVIDFARAIGAPLLEVCHG